MVATRSKNKDAHPAAPVMTPAAKRKAGVPTKPHSKSTSKAQTIRELRARLAVFENPDDETTMISKEPLVCPLFLVPQLISNYSQFTRGSSPPEDVDTDMLVADSETEALTNTGSDDFVTMGGKRVPLNNLDPQ